MECTSVTLSQTKETLSKSWFYALNGFKTLAVAD